MSFIPALPNPQTQGDVPPPENTVLQSFMLWRKMELELIRIAALLYISPCSPLTENTQPHKCLSKCYLSQTRIPEIIASTLPGILGPG